MRNKFLLLIFALTGCVSSHAQQDTIPECVHYEKCALVFPTSRAPQDLFYSKLDSLMAGERGSINIWHVGGSHVQGGTLPYSLMSHFQNLAGKGEKGFIFPKQLAKTHEDSKYRIETEGNWYAPMLTKNPDAQNFRYGITGFAAQTDSNSRMILNIDPQKAENWRMKKLRVLGYASSPEAYPMVQVSGQEIGYQFDTLTSSYVFELPEPTDSLEVNFIVPKGETFVLNGFQPITDDIGVGYFASGVNGAQAMTWTEQCVDLERDLALVKPDLVIFGLGINDSACDSLHFSPKRFKRNYRNLIRKVQSVSPDCAMIFITTNDGYRYSNGKLVYNQNADEARQAMMELAIEYNAGVWDQYGVMGGRGSVYRWREEGLIKKDRLHFTTDGYKLIANLLYNAIINDWNNTKK